MKFKLLSSFVICNFAFPIAFLLSVVSYAQTNPTFRSPLDIPIDLSGTFGEIRVNHFHSGIDIKTGKVGLPVYAAESGFISRIKISPEGYGKALYIEHPNGYTTVYAHLQNFSEKIEQYIRAIQYQKESFSVDEYLPSGLITVQKGEQVAWSGNSGRSEGPHLHFEIRDTKTEIPMNPLAFLNVIDKAAPVMNDLLIYPLEKNIGRFFPVREKVLMKNGSYVLSNDTLRIDCGRVAFGINTYDFMDGRANQNGVYQLTVKADGKTIYHFAMDKFSFNETRYVQTHMDYQADERNDIIVHRCYRLPGNVLPIYDTVQNNGIIQLDTDKASYISIVAKDFNGNTSTLNFFIKYDKTISRPDYSTMIYDTAFDYRDDNTFQNDEVKVFMPKNTCYDSVFFHYEKLSEPVAGKIFSSVHQIHTEEEPAQLYFTLSIKPIGLPERLKDKALIIRETKKPNEPDAKESSWDGEFLKTKTRDFGKYYIVVDTVPPAIKPVNIAENKTMTSLSGIQVKITDDISGINKFRGTVDGQWILMEYDSKNDMLTYFFDEYVKPGEHIFSLIVTDNVANESNYQAKFIL